jgi:hypothetical protein
LKATGTIERRMRDGDQPPPKRKKIRRRRRRDNHDDDWYGPLAPIIKAEPLNAPVSLTFPDGALLLLLFLKERLLDFSVNADQPFFGMSGTVPKIICVCLKFACSFFGCPQLGRKTVGKIHGSVAVCLRQIRRFLHQGDNPMSGVIRHHSGIRGPLFRSERNNRSWCFACLDAHHCSSRH